MGKQAKELLGLILADKYWIYSKGDFVGILKAVLEGFPQKGMPPWGSIIPKEDHNALVAYVLSLKGTHPPNPKAPQGELVE